MIYTIIALAVAFAFGYIGYIKGFRQMWPVLFNVLVSIYLGVMGTRAICKMAEGVDKYQYYKIPLVLVFAIVVYLLLMLAARFFAKEDYIDTLPDAFENFGGAVLGFFSGLVVTGFVVFLAFGLFAKFKDMPEFVKSNIARPSANTVKKSCGFVAGISLQTTRSVCEVPKTVNWLSAYELDLKRQKECKTDSDEENQPESEKVVEENSQLAADTNEPTIENVNP